MNNKVTISLIIVGVLLCIIGFQGEVSSELRTWTLIDDRVWKSNGKNKIEAHFWYKKFGRDDSPDLVNLQLPTGEKISVPANYLSIEDQNFVIPPGAALRGLGVLLCIGTWVLSGILSKGGGGGVSGGAGVGACGGGGGCGGGCGGGE